jgi:phosphoribosylanthranilate isomerase
MSNFRIKICGLTRVSDALAAVAAGADALGLNFSQRSKRRVTVAEALAIVAAVKAETSQVACVGVFVEQSPAEADEMARAVGLDLIQLHGDHAVETLGWGWSRPVLWVQRVPVSAPADLAQTCAAAAQAAVREALAPQPGAGPDPQRTPEPREAAVLAGILVDAYSAAGYGGTGETIDWETLGRRDSWRRLGWSEADWPQELPLVLAGGLHPGNVATAIAQAAPTAVDVASGVELEPGIKCPAKMQAFVAAARTAWGHSRFDGA